MIRKLLFLFVFIVFAHKASAACTTPVDNLVVNADTTLCSGNYTIEDVAQDGLIKVFGSDLTLDCNGTILNSVTGKYGWAIYSTGPYDNVTITGCNIYNYQAGIYIYSLDDNMDNWVIWNNSFINSNYNMYLRASASGTFDSTFNYAKIYDNVYDNAGIDNVLFYSYNIGASFVNTASFDYNLFENNTMTGAVTRGLYALCLGSKGSGGQSTFAYMRHNRIRNNVIEDNGGAGMLLYGYGNKKGATAAGYIQNNNISFNTISNNAQGIYLNTYSNTDDSAPGIGQIAVNNFFNNTIINSSVAGIEYATISCYAPNPRCQFYSNKFYNNNVQNNGGVAVDFTTTAYSGIHFRNTHYNNIYNGSVSDTLYTSNWNTSNTTGFNIVGGPNTGGNWYSAYSGNDTDGDWFGDTPYTIPGGRGFTDSFPLITGYEIVLATFNLNVSDFGIEWIELIWT